MKAIFFPLIFTTLWAALSTASAQLILDPDFTTAPTGYSGNLVRDNTTKNVWLLKNSADTTYDPVNDWLENTSDARGASNLMYIAGNTPTYTAGSYTFKVQVANDEIVTGGLNTQRIEYGIFGLANAGSWGSTDNFNITSTGTTNIPTNAVVLHTGTFDLSTDHPAMTDFISDAFTIGAGYDDIVIRLSIQGVGAVEAAEEFVRLSSANLQVVPEPTSGMLLIVAAVGFTTLRCSRRR